MAEPSTTGSPHGGSRDTMYRRPPARPAADDPPWFGSSEPSTGETPAVSAPDYGPATPGGNSRISFGFTSSPISPVRHPASPTSPAAPPMPTVAPEPAPSAAAPSPTGLGAPDLPVRRVSTHTGEQRRVSGTDGDDFRRTSETSAGSSWVTGTGSERAGDIAGSAWTTDTAGSGRATDATGSGWTTGGGSGRLAGFGSGRATDTGSGRDTGEFRRVAGADGGSGEFRRASDTGEFRRFLEAEDRPAETGEQRRVAVQAPPAPRQSRAVTVGIVMLSLIVLVAGGIVGVTYFTGNNGKLDSVLQLGAGGDSGERTVTAPLDNRSQATFEVLAATNRVNVTIGELGDDLFRISTPEDAGFRPDPTIRNDDVKLQVTKDGDGTGGEINVVLAAKVLWGLRFSGYAEEQVINLSGGQISGLEMVGGMRKAEISLARPSGTVPIKVNGAVEKLVLTSPSGSPVRVKVGGGAKTIVAGSRTLTDVPAGSTVTPKNWAVQNRYDVGAGAPITNLTVENG
ncbi:hypothetical protein JIG36_24320 [Actinoplanes sp. LDG1-06]|uniref:Adhesin domain-containing protein n=1 Tax=Paractinoplanes ovalisporus TaxID=2810368 RepID=A0ABS2AFT5_9ACTN|nr:hypothetical protein [Actinoplanes ovalisporus]MBM2618688.1 hypothetical protein [Actinoplanes ovalisporus]